MRQHVADRHGKSRREGAREYFSDPSRYLSSNPNLAVRSEIVGEMLDGSCRGTALDLGCGDGRLSVGLLPNIEMVVFVDSARGMLELAAQRARAAELPFRLVLGDVDDPTLLASELFEVVLMVGVLAHVADPQRALDNASRLLRPGGRMVVQFTDVSHPLTKLALKYAAFRHRSQPYQQTQLDGPQVRAMAQGCGLQVEAARAHLGVLPGTSRLPAQFIQWLQLWTYRHPKARLGAERFYVLRRINEEQRQR